MPSGNIYDRLSEQIAKKAEETVVCASCGSWWMEEVSIGRFQRAHYLLVGQEIPRVVPGEAFKLLRCVQCGQLHEPRLDLGIASLETRVYEKFSTDLSNRLKPITS